jgi:alpha-L-rhamnosidase
MSNTSKKRIVIQNCAGKISIFFFFSMMLLLFYYATFISIVVGSCPVDVTDLKLNGVLRRSSTAAFVVDVSNSLSFSWRLQANLLTIASSLSSPSPQYVTQTAYQVSIWNENQQQLLWTSELQHSNRTLNIRCERCSQLLKSLVQYHATVQITSSYSVDGGNSTVSCNSSLEATFRVAPSAQDWSVAQWLQRNDNIPVNDCAMYADNPVPLFRKEFKLAFARERIRSALLYFTGVGFAEAYINGRKVSDGVLEPTWTAFDRTVLFDALDVADSLADLNCIGVMLGNGWWNQLPLRMWGSRDLRDALPVGLPMFRLRLLIEFDNGQRQSVDSTAAQEWHVGNGSIIRNNIYLGEVFDESRQLQLQNWSTVGFHEATQWPAPVVALSPPNGTLQLRTAPPVDVVEQLKPISVRELQPGVAIVDFGVNFAGWVSITVPHSCDTLLLRYGEVLFSNGSLNVLTSTAGQIKNGNGGPCAPFVAFQSDTVQCDPHSTLHHFRPTFTWHAFRFVEISGYSSSQWRPSLDAFVGMRVQSRLRDSTNFQCSSGLVNRIHEIIRNSYRANLIGVQSDCPHRERFGYTGDVHASAQG